MSVDVNFQKMFNKGSFHVKSTTKLGKKHPPSQIFTKLGVLIIFMVISKPLIFFFSISKNFEFMALQNFMILLHLFFYITKNELLQFTLKNYFSVTNAIIYFKFFI